jgi:hypothetical protein
MPVRGILVFAVLAAAVVVGPAASAPAVNAKLCRDATGAPFAFSVGDSHYSGSSYRVSAASVPCAFATSWVSKLTHRVPAKGQVVLKTLQGPAGWTCKASGTVSVLRLALTISGTCFTGSAASPLKLFQWSADTRSGQTPPIVLDPTVTTGSGSTSANARGGSSTPPTTATKQMAGGVTSSS